MEENMSVIGGTKMFYFNFDWPKNVDDNLKHKIEFIIKTNEPLAKNKIKNETEQLLLKYKDGNNVHEHKNSKMNGPYKFVLNLSQRLNLRSLDKHFTFQNLSIYYVWKNIRKQFKKNKLKMIDCMFLSCHVGFL